MRSVIVFILLPRHVSILFPRHVSSLLLVDFFLLLLEPSLPLLIPSTDTSSLFLVKVYVCVCLVGNRSFGKKLEERTRRETKSCRRRVSVGAGFEFQPRFQQTVEETVLSQLLFKKWRKTVRETLAGNTGEYRKNRTEVNSEAASKTWTTFIKEWVKNRKKEKKKNENLYFLQNINFLSLPAFCLEIVFRNFNTTSSFHRRLLFLDERQEQLVFVTRDKHDNEQVKLKEQQIIINFYLIVHLLLLLTSIHIRQNRFLLSLWSSSFSFVSVTQGIIVFFFHFQF